MQKSGSLKSGSGSAGWQLEAILHLKKKPVKHHIYDPDFVCTLPLINVHPLSLLWVKRSLSAVAISLSII